MTKNKKTKIVTNLVPDFELWAKVSKTVVPVNADLAAELALFEKENSKSGIVSILKSKQSPKHVVSSQKDLQNSSAHDLTGLDKGLQRKFLRGQAKIEGRIDLHGESRSSARAKLLGFIERSAFENKKTVLVITGKGETQFSRHTLHSRDFHDSSPRTGKLRLEVPYWLSEPEFRRLITGYQPAHPKHGGGGALYVQLRNLSKGVF